MTTRIVLYQLFHHLSKRGTSFALANPKSASAFMNRTNNNLLLLSISRHLANEASQSEDGTEGEAGSEVVVDPSKDRRVAIPVEVSMSYLNSKSKCLFLEHETIFLLILPKKFQAMKLPMVLNQSGCNIVEIIKELGHQRPASPAL